MTALTKTLIEEIKSAPESVQREVFDFLASLKGRRNGYAEAVEEHAAWHGLAAQGLAGAYGPDEPDYSDALLKERNPRYEGR